MANKTTKLVLVAALVVTAACSKKRPEVLPPAPVENAGASDQATPASGDANGSVVPGSNADFQRSVTSNTVRFGLDQYDIDPEARAILDNQAQWLQRYPNQRITIEGHCDERGTREYNLALGDRRANAAKNYLAARGVAASRISTISYGKERPVATGSDDASMAENRRAVTVVLS